MSFDLRVNLSSDSDSSDKKYIVNIVIHNNSKTGTYANKDMNIHAPRMTDVDEL